jgi:hypothetical protein
MCLNLIHSAWALQLSFVFSVCDACVLLIMPLHLRSVGGQASMLLPV